VTLAELVADLERRAVDAERLGASAPVASVLRAVLADLRAVDGATLADPDDTLLTVAQVAPQLGVSPWWLYRNARTLPFARKLGRRTLRFSEKGLRRWLLRRVA